MTDSRQQILDRIKQALSTSVPAPFDAETDRYSSLYQQRPPDLDVAFAQAFTQLQGQFGFCLNLAEMAKNLAELGAARGWTRWYCADSQWREQMARYGFAPNWHTNLADCHAAITGAEALVARTGSLLLSSKLPGGRTASVYAPVHICLAFSQQLVWDIEDAISLLNNKYGADLPSQITLASGPSRTADIEKTLVTGVHGPKEVFCLLAEAP